jgi:hypothetical protein
MIAFDVVVDLYMQYILHVLQLKNTFLRQTNDVFWMLDISYLSYRWVVLCCVCDIEKSCGITTNFNSLVPTAQTYKQGRRMTPNSNTNIKIAFTFQIFLSFDSQYIYSIWEFTIYWYECSAKSGNTILIERLVCLLFLLLFFLCHITRSEIVKKNSIDSKVRTFTFSGAAIHST